MADNFLEQLQTLGNEGITDLQEDMKEVLKTLIGFL